MSPPSSESNKAHPCVLLLSSAEDGHALVMIERLKEMDVSFEILSAEQFSQSSGIHYKIAKGVHNSPCFIEKSGRRLDFRQFSAVWHRRPGKLKIPAFPEKWIGEMVASELGTAWDSMLQAIDCIWVNHPGRDQIAAQKLEQLKLAARLGFDLPPTLITNDPEQVMQFYQECDGQLIYKFMNDATNFAIPAFEVPRGLATLPVRERDLQFLEQVKYAPHLFQKKIEKIADVRTTVIGHRVFSTFIDSQKSNTGNTDWRLDYSVVMEPHELPEHVAELCKSLLRELRLNYGAFDFCLTKDGSYVFLEVNSMGQYLWVEERTSVPLSAELAMLLAGKAEPLVTDVAVT